MGFNTISTIAHSIEDLFSCERPEIADYSSLTDLILEGVILLVKRWRDKKVSRMENG